MTVLRLRYKRLGGHMHCRLFTAPRPGTTFAKNGDLVFSVEEWASVRAWLEPRVEFIDEDDAWGAHNFDDQ